MKAWLLKLLQDVQKGNSILKIKKKKEQKMIGIYFEM